MQQAIQIIDAEIQQYEEWRLLHRAKGRTIEACAAALCQAAFRRLRNKIAQLMEWQDMESAPKDGTKIVLAKADWVSMPTAHWGEYPANPVEGDEGQIVYMKGWIIEDNFFSEGDEDGFLGWEDDPKPTHWMHTPPKQGSE